MAAPSPPPRRLLRLGSTGRRRLFAAVRIVLGLGVLAVIVSLVKPSAFRPLGTGPHLAWAAFAIACLALNVYVAAWRWQLLLTLLGVRERIAPLLRAVYVGAFYNLVLPGQLGGQAIKVMLVGRRSPALPAIIASVAMDQLVVIVALLALALVTSASAPGIAERGGWLLGFGSALAISIALLTAAVTPQLQDRLRRRARRSRWLVWLPAGLRHQTSRTWASMTSYGRQPLLVSWAVGQGMVFMLTLGGMALGVARSLGIDLDPRTILFVLLLGLVAGVAPFTVAGLGTREAAFTAALFRFGVPTATGAAFSVLWLLLNSLADAVGGIMQFWHPRQTGTLEPPRPRPPAAG